jgi:hypothetical protein
VKNLDDEKYKGLDAWTRLCMEENEQEEREINFALERIKYDVENRRLNKLIIGISLGVVIGIGAIVATYYINKNKKNIDYKNKYDLKIDSSKLQNEKNNSIKKVHSWNYTCKDTLNN